ncbi:hypothetical protein [Zavarzinella formosa]|uniref:hypothetical protein n=1 Tax=Zavarzinella formosa TaxID=360055 RepID=UPI0002E6FE57|nr:hypothetical protein [Zavarzinella formosa]
MRRILSLLPLILAPSLACGLATEQLGNGPLNQSFGLADDLLAIANMDSRVYWYEVNANPTFFFKGDAKELNKAIAKFTAMKHDKKEIILLAGTGETQTLLRDKKIAYDWIVHVPHGFHFGGDSEVADTRATLTIRIPGVRAKTPEKPEQLTKWITELNSDDFKTRAGAETGIEALGTAAIPAILKALNDKPAAEARDRLERLRDRAGQTVSLDLLEIPTDTLVIGSDTLLARARKEMSNKAPDVRGYAVSSLPTEHMKIEDVVKEYEQILKTEKNEYPLRCALGGVSRLGVAAKPLIPLLREVMKTDDKNVKSSCQYAIDEIEKEKEAKEIPADTKTITTIRTEIGELVAARKTTKPK